MEENFHYTNKFLRENKNFIISLFNRDTLEDDSWNEEQQKAAEFSLYVRSVLEAINVVCGLLDNRKFSRTDAEALLISQFASPLGWALGKLADETDKLQLLPTVINFITPDVMNEYIRVSIRKLTCSSNSSDVVAFFKYLEDNNISLVRYVSPYKYFVNFVFISWVGHKEETFNTGLSQFEAATKISIYKQQFDIASWFLRLNQLIDLEYTDEQKMEVLRGIINDYTQIVDEDCKIRLLLNLGAFMEVLYQFRELDKYCEEEDDRENFFGIVIPKEKSDEEKRIEAAADYLVEKHYITGKDKELFVNIMNGRSPSGKIRFSHGMGVNGEKKKGGETVLYGILRFIREDHFNPDTKEDDRKRQHIPDYSADCSHFIFDDKETDIQKRDKWKKIKDSGSRSAKSGTLSQLIADLNLKLQQM